MTTYKLRNCIIHKIKYYFKRNKVYIIIQLQLMENAIVTQLLMVLLII